MTRRHEKEDHIADPASIEAPAVRAQLRPNYHGSSHERRNLSSRRALVRRFHGEFLEMPGLTLSIEQAARLFSLPPGVCARVFGELIDEDLLRLTANGHYALVNAERAAR